MKLPEFFSSFNFIKILNLVELVLYLYLLNDRYKVLQNNFNIPLDLRPLIDLYEYENGWGFIFLFILILSIILIFRNRRMAWVIKIIGLFCLTGSYILSMQIIGFVFILLLIYYFQKKIMLEFGIQKKKKFIIIALTIALFLSIISMFFDIFKY